MSRQTDVPQTIAVLFAAGCAFRARETITYPDGTRVEREIVVPGRAASVPAVWQPTLAQVDWYRGLMNGGALPYTDYERDLYYRIEAWDRGLPYSSPPDEPVRFNCPAPCIGSRYRSDR